MPTAAEVEHLYAAASAEAPLHESPDVARLYAMLYEHARLTSGAITVAARRSGTLVGFGYGHTWRWQSEVDNWSLQLRASLGAHADLLDESFALALMAVSPIESGVGLGRRLLDLLLEGDDHAVAWLQTTDLDTPARRLYERSGWRPLGHGPKAPNGEPGLVMIYHRR